MVDGSKPKAELGALRARHSKALNELERYRLLVESVEDYAIFMLDADGKVRTWNKGAQKAKGYSSEEIIGKHFSIFYLEADREAHKPEHALRLARRYGRMEDEDWRVRKDGSRFWADVVITALYDERHQLVGYAKVTRDLTSRRQHERELSDANKVLTRQQRDLRRLNASKDEFIMLASHQLRTPATSVKQFLALVLDGFMGDLNARQAEFIQQAYDSNERQIAIINDLLRIAQIDGGKVALKKTATDIEQLVTSVVNAQKDSFRTRQQSVLIRMPSDPVLLPVDQGHFRMVIENLIDNASKYTPARGTVTIDLSRPSAGEVRIVVEDTGVGISTDDQHKLFEKFSRIPNRLSDRVGGSGLGLYWVKQIIELHGGRIGVESEVDKGTRFIVDMPAEVADA